MATDHYTRLGIEKEKFYELDEKGKKELVEKQFRGSTGNLLSKLFDIFFPGLAEKRLVKLRDAKDILKDERVRKYYDFSLENGEKPNVDYNSLKNHLDNPGKFDQEIKKLQETLDSINSEMKNVYNIGKSIEVENLRKINTETMNIVEKMEKLDKSRIAIEKINEEQIEQIKEKLEKIKTGREGREGDITRNETVSKVITHLESELKGLMENVLKIKTAKINDLDSKLKRTGDEDERSKIRGEITKIVNEHSKLLKELNDLDSKQPKKGVGQQDELTNIPPKFTNISTEKNLKVLKDQFEKGLEKAGIDIKGMGHKEVLEKLKDNFLLNAQYKMIKEFEGKSEQQTKPDAEKAVDSKIPNIPLTDNVKKLVSNASEVNQSALLPKSSKAKPVVNMPIISPLPSVQKLIDQHETSRVDGTKLNHEPKPDINNNTKKSFAQQVSQEKEIQGQLKR